MSDNLLKLLKGELKRLMKYNILQISFAVALLWIAVIFLIGREQATTFVPLFIFMDAALMTVLYVGANLFYEKQENTLKTLLITPSGYVAVLASKIIAAVYLALQSSVIISLAAFFLFDVQLDFLALYSAVVLIAFAHAALGFSFAIVSRDFNGLIAAVGLYMIFLAFPSIFFAFGLIPERFEAVMLLSPTHASMMLIDASFGKTVALWTVLVSTAYLAALAAGLLLFFIGPKYRENAVRE